MTSSLGGVLLGLLLGARHAFEPDHLAAVSVLSSEKPDVRRGALLGAFWGAGHTAALLAVAFALAILRTEMPSKLGHTFELGVAVMLVGLGLRALRRALHEGRVGLVTTHSHGSSVHRHAGPASHVHVGPWTLARRPFVVGLVHGLAGSGALTALVAASLSSWTARLAFVAFFGLGSVLGMSMLSGLAGWPLARLGRRPRVAASISALAGVVSVFLGVVWGWPLVMHLSGATW